MLRANRHAPAGQWPSELAVDSVTLDFAARHRRRIRLVTDRRADLLLDLARAVAMAEGDGLALEDGRWLAVRAAPEPLLEISCADRRQLMRIAWHLGNRHLPTEILEDRLRIRPDHVIAGMVRGLGGRVAEIVGPFQPEGGAYAGADAHHHRHDR